MTRDAVLSGLAVTGGGVATYLSVQGMYSHANHVGHTAVFLGAVIPTGCAAAWAAIAIGTAAVDAGHRLSGRREAPDPLFAAPPAGRHRTGGADDGGRVETSPADLAEFLARFKGMPPPERPTPPPPAEPPAAETFPWDALDYVDEDAPLPRRTPAPADAR